MLNENGEAKLVINGMEIDKFSMAGEIGTDEDTVVYTLPDHMLIDKKNSIKWIGEIEEEEAEGIQRLFGIDADQLENKKVRVFFQVLGPAAKKR